MNSKKVIVQHMFSQIILVNEYLICTIKLQLIDFQYPLFLKKSNN